MIIKTFQTLLLTFNILKYVIVAHLKFYINIIFVDFFIFIIFQAYDLLLIKFSLYFTVIKSYYSYLGIYPVTCPVPTTNHLGTYRVITFSITLVVHALRF